MDLRNLDVSKLIDLTEASAEKIIVVSLLVAMMAYVINILVTSIGQGIGITREDSGIEPTTLPSVPEEPAEGVDSEGDGDGEGEGDVNKSD